MAYVSVDLGHGIIGCCDVEGTGQESSTWTGTHTPRRNRKGDKTKKKTEAEAANKKKKKKKKEIIMSSFYVPTGQQRSLRACMVCSIVQVHSVRPDTPRPPPIFSPFP